MSLDFLTLYVVILCNSIGLTIVWGAIAWAYRDFSASRYWLASAVSTTLGGLCLSFEAVSFLFAISGIALVVAGFCATWLGLQAHYRLPRRWYVASAITVLSVAAMLVVSSERPPQNVVYAVFQTIPIILSLAILVPRIGKGSGALIAACGMTLAIIGHSFEAGENLLRLMGALSTDAYYEVASLNLLAVIFGVGLWNMGFLLLGIDHLRADLAKIAVTDDLTGLPNRRALMATLSALERDVSPSRPVHSIVMIDVDYFKAVNDTFGHSAGDACLRHLGVVASEVVGSRGLVARISGDELCVVLPGAALIDAEMVATQLAQEIGRRNFIWAGLPVHCSISVGTAEWGHEATASEVMEAADRRLYQAKQQRGPRAAQVRQRPALSVIEPEAAVLA